MFLKYGHVPTPDELDQMAADGVVPTPPTLVQFQEQVKLNLAQLLMALILFR